MRPYGIRKDTRYELIAAETVCESDIVSVRREHVRLPHGYETKQDFVYLPEAVAVVPLLMDEAGHYSVVLVEQFRNSVRGFMHEIPAGIVEAGEDPEACARRELEEETGYRAERVQRLASLLAIPGCSDHRLHYFLAEGLTRGSQNLDDSECLHVREFPLDELVRSMVEDPPGSSVVVDGKTHLAILHTARLLETRERKESPS